MPLLRLRRTMASRDPDEAHRASTPLELFFDLTFVVAIAQAANSLHHGLAEGHAQNVLVGYPLVFFGIWWAWMNFSWFASAYDTDDVLYRLAVLVQIAGVLVYAAGVPRAMEHQDFTVGVLGYVIMRVGLISQWLRAARSDPEHRACCLRYAGGIFVCQLCWIGLLAVPDALFLPGFLVLRGRRAVRAVVGRAGGRDVVAPAAHRRALRALHHHRAGRVRARGDDRRAERARRRRHAWRSSARSPSAAC